MKAEKSFILNSSQSLSKYRIMWIIVYFDLPTKTITDKREYTTFRKFLLKDGFEMLQYSIYCRHCSSRENMNVHLKRVKRNLPYEGKISVFNMTDAQFALIEMFSKGKMKNRKAPPEQLGFFD